MKLNELLITEPEGDPLFEAETLDAVGMLTEADFGPAIPIDDYIAHLKALSNGQV